MYLQSLLLAAAFAGQIYADGKKYKYVAAFSVDGLHASDVTKYIALRPKSTIAELLETSYEYTAAYTSAPSDSFPGCLNQYTGASPRTTGVWYDDTYDRTFWDPFSVSGTNCSGPPGAEGLQLLALFSGGIDPVNLPQAIIDKNCTYVYPHQRLRVNTVFEIVHESGIQTAYADKHPAYDLVRGPSGKGLSVGYFPEMASIGPTVEDTIAYDQLHVDAFLDWISSTTPANSKVQEKLTGTPSLFGGNLQAVSVGQKTSGYVAKSLDFTPELLKALDFVDSSLGKIVSALKAKEIYEDTLIIVASKHGHAPIDPTKYAKISPSLVPAATSVKVAFTTTDDIALIFLANSADTDAVVDDIIYGPQLIAQGFGNPLTDPAVPDIIVRPVEGIIYSDSTAKIAEHGGLNEDDRHVAYFVSAQGLKARKFPCQVSTRQVAPTILKGLGLDEGKLPGVTAEGTQVLDGFADGDVD